MERRRRITLLVALVLAGLIGIQALIYGITTASAGSDPALQGNTSLNRSGLLAAAKPGATSTPATSGTSTPTRTPTATSAPKGGKTATSTPTRTPTRTPTAQPAATSTPTATPTAIPASTATPTALPTATPTATATSAPLPTATPTATPTLAPTATPTLAPTATPTATATSAPLPTATPTATATPTLAPTATPMPTATPTLAPTATPTATATLPPPTATATATLAPTPTATPTGGTIPTSTNTLSYGTQVLDLLNAQRTANGCQPLVYNQKLWNAAQKFSYHLASNGYLSHTGKDGSTMTSRVTAEGYAWSVLAENIGAGYGTPSAMVTTWMNSATHRANILNCALTEVGIGYYYINPDPNQTTNYKHYWVADFGTPATASPADGGPTIAAGDAPDAGNLASPSLDLAAYRRLDG